MPCGIPVLVLNKEIAYPLSYHRVASNYVHFVKRYGCWNLIKTIGKAKIYHVCPFFLLSVASVRR